MININFLVAALAALIPLLTGFIWYNPKVMGNAWMKETGLTPEDGKKVNMAKIFGLTYLFSFMMAVLLHTITIHQFGVQSALLAPDLMKDGTELHSYFADFMSKYGHNYRTFKHGALHGSILAIFIIMPVVGINVLFEQKRFKYIWIHTGYWVLTLALMGGVICQWA